MFESLISHVLNKVLGDFIENIDPAQLNISIMNGNVVLTNMKLKKSFFDAMPLPFTLVYGRIGLLNLQIPVWNLFNQPLVVEISDVFALVRPKHLKEWSEDVELNAFKSATQSQLEQYEMTTLITQQASSLEKLAAKIIDNLQVKVKNIYVRYEDEYSGAPTHGMLVVGVSLQEFAMHTTDAQGQPSEASGNEEVTHKAAIVKNFSVFMDYEEVTKVVEEAAGDYAQIIEEECSGTNKHRNMVDRFGLEARVKLNKKPKEN